LQSILLQRAMACEVSVASLWMFGDLLRGSCWVRHGIASYKQGDHYGLSGIGTLQQMWEPALPAMRRAGGARSGER
ncbi:hypothetical protein, partial [Pseudomonas bharatica]|uniref:hypothetical protein n=1 Tax=Pseudomonas bharatica TaxID=2692112 RepID=UPI003B27E572